MIIRSVAFFLVASFSLNTYAQVKGSKGHTHYVGLQANQLLKQLFNFSSSSTSINNPYLLNYAVNSDSTGMGFNFGFGYSFDEFETGDAIFERTTAFNDFSIRIGIEKKHRLGKRWLASIGGDVVVDRQSNKTTTKNDTDFNKSTIVTDNKISGLGLGPRLGLIFGITDRILLGTECTYYFKSITSNEKGSSKITTREFDPFTGSEREVTRTESTDDENTFKKLQLNPPAVLFLIMKF
jgi:hypothetical protein